MTHSHIAVLWLAASLAAAFPARAESASAAYLRKAVLEQNSLGAAEFYLGDLQTRDRLKAEDSALADLVFARSAELVDMRKLLYGQVTARSIRLGVLDRPMCAFCRDASAFKAWVERDKVAYDAKETGKLIDQALWEWPVIPDWPKAWLSKSGLEAGWGALGFEDRHARMRRWAETARDELRKSNPGNPAAVRDAYARAALVREVLGNHEMTDVWHRLEEAGQAVSSLDAAEERLKRNNDPRMKALLEEARSAADPAARLTALAQIFEGLGERRADLLALAPPREDQRFTPESREVVARMLAGALMKEVEGTWAGEDLKAFYADRPLRVAFSQTGFNFDGWYTYGTDVLNFNERSIEGFVKARDRTVEDLKRDPVLLGDLARTLVPIFVHEAQHHRQDVWARGQGLKNYYNQGSEVEAYQVHGLFVLQKLRSDPAYRAWAEREGEDPAATLLKGDLALARRIEESGPSFIDWKIPNGHYPEVFSNEALAWCSILWHNDVAAAGETELKRRAGLSAAERARLETAAGFKERYGSEELFREALREVGTPHLRESIEDQRVMAADASRVYGLIRGREIDTAALTRARYDQLMSGKTPARREPPSPSLPVKGRR